MEYVGSMVKFGTGGFVDCYLQFVFDEDWGRYNSELHGRLSLQLLSRFRRLYS